MKSHEVRSKFLEFFVERRHAILPPASLIPENDPTTLFTNSGVHPLVPYILQGSHPLGPRLVSVQKCFRTDDIEEVGDNSHHTFFEMLGNWSIGDYFKKEAIFWSFEFLTSKNWAGINPEKLFVSVFAGDKETPRDDNSAKIWQEAFVQVGIDAKIGEKIFVYSKEKNWWGPAGKTGPCGPDTEIFYDTQQPHNPAFGEKCHLNCDCGRYIELWNNVFMEFNKDETGRLTPLQQKNVDTGMSLERLVRILEGVGNNYETSLFLPLMKKLENLAGKKTEEGRSRHARIVADHLRAAVFLIADGVEPGKVERGSVLRRVVRRAIRHAHLLSIERDLCWALGQVVVDSYSQNYPELSQAKDRIERILVDEEKRFSKTLQSGLGYFEKLIGRPEVQTSGLIAGQGVFDLYQSYGFPFELTEELAAEKNIKVSRKGFEQARVAHQEISRAGVEKRFAGGLADHSEETTKLHTTTHLLHRALQEILGEHVRQAGSNITRERLRFDFTHPSKATREELSLVEKIVNQKIKENLPVYQEIVALEEAHQRGAIGLFGEKYGDQVKIYIIGEPNDPYSIECCGGPHVGSTGEIGKIRITKEGSAGSGMRRIYVVREESS